MVAVNSFSSWATGGSMNSNLNNLSTTTPFRTIPWQSCIQVDYAACAFCDLACSNTHSRSGWVARPDRGRSSRGISWLRCHIYSCTICLSFVVASLKVLFPSFMKCNICFTDPTVDKPYGSHEGKKEPRSEYFMPAWTKNEHVNCDGLAHKMDIHTS